MNRAIDWGCVLGVGLAMAGAMVGAMAGAASDPVPYVAGTVRIAGATPSGEFNTFARAACALVRQAGIACIPVETLGALDNVRRLKLGVTDPDAVDMGIVKGNLADEFQQEPGFHDRFVFVRYIAGDAGEAVLLVMTAQTAQAVSDWPGITDAAYLLSMGLPGELSGDATVLNALRAMAGSPLQVMEVKPYQGRMQLIDAVQSGQVRIGWLVQYPNPDNPVFKRIAEAGLVVMGVIDPELLQLGASVAVQDVTIASTCWSGVCWPANTIHTTTIRTAIVARASSSYPDAPARDIQNAAIHAIQQAGDTDFLPRPPQSWVRVLIDWAAER